MILTDYNGHLPVVHTGAVPTGEMILSTRPGLTVPILLY